MNTTMNQIEISKPGSPEVLRKVVTKIPSVEKNEVLIKVFAAGVNRPDIMQRQGKYPMPEGVNPIPGLEVAGEIIEIGSEVSSWKIGDKVCALTEGGGYAEYCKVPNGQVLPIPNGFTFAQAACLPETFFTVYANLFQLGNLAPGQTVLVHGGTSGIGTTAIAICKALGVEVFATAKGPIKSKALTEMGVIPIDYSTQDFSEVIDNKTKGIGVDIVLDIVGASYFNDNIKSLKKGGRLIIIGFMGGTVLNDGDLMSLVLKRVIVTGSTMRSRSALEKSEIAQKLKSDIWPLLESGKCLPPNLSNEFGLEDAVEAHYAMESSEHIGKIVLTI